MKLARIVFTIAGIWGIAVLVPFYWLVDITGRQYAAPADYPAFFFGFIAVALAWQLGFLAIGRDPMRFRPFMILAMVEKFSYVLTLVVLFSVGRITSIDLQPAFPDGLLGLLFIVAFIKTRDRGLAQSSE